MVICFPNFYPDELFYSACARFADRMDYRDKRFVVQELFGTRNAIASVMLPSHLAEFINSLSDSYAYTSDYIIDEHTLLPFYAPFLPPARLKRIRTDMINGDGRSLHMRTGIMAGRIPTQRYLRFCPLCAKEDTERFGECYWHRLHQIPGVEVCPDHQVFLQESIVPTSNAKIRHEFTTAENAIQDLLSPVCLDVTNISHRFLLLIAQDASWLLKQKGLSVGSKGLRKRYLTALATKELATFSGRVRMTTLLSKFKDYYPPESLNILHCELQEGIEDNWLCRLLHESENSQPPICYLLLIYFLGYTVETFIALPENYQPFGEGPWPCLNSTCERFRQPCIAQCQITYSKYSDGRPTGVFSCSCGFVYSRKGPDNSDEDYNRIGKLISFGRVWEETLRKLWNDREISLRETARRLGVDPTTVKYQAKRLGLIQQTESDISKIEPPDISSNGGEKVFLAIQEKYRTKWLSGIQETFGKGIMDLRAKMPEAYIWLYKNDREWLLEHLPVRKPRSKPSQSRIDWKARDKELVKQVKLAEARLRNQSEVPIHLTKTSIFRETGQMSLIEKHQDKLPKTMKMLSSLIENRCQWAVRRLWWAGTYFKQEGIIPLEWQLIKKAGVERLVHDPIIQETIKEIMHSMFS